MVVPGAAPDPAESTVPSAESAAPEKPSEAHPENEPPAESSSFCAGRRQEFSICPGNSGKGRPADGEQPMLRILKNYNGKAVMFGFVILAAGLASHFVKAGQATEALPCGM